MVETETITFTKMMQRGLDGFGINEHNLLVLEDILIQWVDPRGGGRRCITNGYIDIDEDGRVQTFQSPRLVKLIPSSIGQLKHLRQLVLDLDDTMTSLPEEIGNLSNLAILQLTGGEGITTLPFIGRLRALEDLVITCKGITTLPSIGRLRALRNLEISCKGITTLPFIGRLRALKYLRITCKRITTLPHSIGQSQNLQTLNLNDAKQLTQLPDKIGNLSQLIVLSLDSSGVESLPPSIGQLHNLEELYLNYTTQLKQLPDEIGSLGNLVKLHLFESGVESLPRSIGLLQNLLTLDLSSTAQLTQLPDEIGNLSQLITLYLDDNGVTCLPRSIGRSIGRLHNLQQLYLRWTSQLTQLPDEIGNLGNLVILRLVDSGVESLPSSIGQLQALRALDLRGTRHLVQLPDEIGNLGKLVALRLEGSRVESPPSLIEYSLACSRFRSRALMVSPTGNHEWPTIRQNQWPIILENATHTFRAHGRNCYDTMEENGEFSGDDEEEKLRGLEAHDAIYRLLLTDCYRESFVEMLINRNNQQNKKRKLNLQRDSMS